MIEMKRKRPKQKNVTQRAVNNFINHKKDFLRELDVQKREKLDFLMEGVKPEDLVPPKE